MFMISLNWGIIGPGNIANDFAVDLELVKPRQKIVAVLGRTPEHSDAFASRFNVPAVFEELEDFVNYPGLEIAYIATPHPMHYQQALHCLQNKIHVLCEKPMTLNAEQCKALIEASRANKVFLMEAMWIRFLPSIRKVLSIIKEGHIGKLLSLKAFMGYLAPKEEDSRYFDPKLGGGSLLDLGIYPLFLSQILFGSPQAIKAFGSLASTGVDEACAMLLGFENKAHALLESSLVSQTTQPVEITGENGVIKILNPWFEKSIGIELQIHGKEKQLFPTEWEGHGLYFEIDEVLSCIRNNRLESELIPHAFSLALCETMDTIRDQINVRYKMYE